MTMVFASAGSLPPALADHGAAGESSWSPLHLTGLFSSSRVSKMVQKKRAELGFIWSPTSHLTRSSKSTTTASRVPQMQSWRSNLIARTRPSKTITLRTAWPRCSDNRALSRPPQLWPAPPCSASCHSRSPQVEPEVAAFLQPPVLPSLVPATRPLPGCAWSEVFRVRFIPLAKRTASQGLAWVGGGLVHTGAPQCPFWGIFVP